VVLSHRNLLTNLAQLSARIDFNASDVVLNALPVFHSFGLTGARCCRCSMASAP
jgi:acyl-[acyl-carrier-protein]-phospholipid O-acyltransferase/long-chain-fatty-acid--[acyl-carrier-protein] ligase